SADECALGGKRLRDRWRLRERCHGHAAATDRTRHTRGAREADTRSDLWALGCVLFEMATGRRAFEGRSQASLITAIMGSEPPSVSQVSPVAPQGLDRLVRTLLTKDPDERVQTAHDVKLQLQGIAEGGSQVGSALPAVGPRRRRLSVASLIAVAASLLAVTLAGFILFDRLAPKRPVILSLTAPEHARFREYASNAVISPDGRAIAYLAEDSSGTANIWLQPLNSPEATRLMRARAGAGIGWSPDSRNLAITTMGKLLSVAIGGGTPVELCSAPNARGVAWGADHVLVLANGTQGPLRRIAATGGEVTDATRLDSTRHEAAHRFPCFLPDGKHFLYASLPPGPEGFGIFVTSLGSWQGRKIMNAESAPVYAEPGYLLFRRAGKIMAQRFNARAMKLEDGPFALADAPPVSDIDAEPIASASNDGRLVHLVGQYPETELQWYDRSGATLGTLSVPLGRWGRPVLSPDDRFAAVVNDGDLWRIDLARSAAVRLTSTGDLVSDAVWSPDGGRVAYTRGLRGREEVHILSSDGTGEERLLSTTNDLFKSPDDWTQAGLVIWSISNSSLRDVWLVPDNPGAKPIPVIRTRYGESGSQVSPDGRWIAYLSNEAGVEDVYVQSFPVPGHKVRVTSEGVGGMWWMPGSDELCYRAVNGRAVKSVKLTRTGEDLDVGQPSVLFQFGPQVIRSDFSRDGKRILVNATSPGAQERRFRVVLDWPEMLER
ncbi:MAG: hypothetical protein ABIU54_13650, partial [Candidatus Eisenbacteria bacterium]